jgi:hypothetical protein
MMLFLWCMVDLHLKYYKQRSVTAIVTNIMLYIRNLHGKCPGTLIADQSSHIDKTVDLSQNDQIQAVAKTSPVLHFSSLTSIILQSCDEGRDKETDAFGLIQDKKGQNSVFSNIFTLAFFRDVDKFTNDFINNFISK